MAKQRRPRKPKDVVQEVARRIREGESDSEIAKALSIHRTTVARYRARFEGETVFRMARAALVRDALTKHFEDLCQLLGRLQEQVSVPSPEHSAIEDLEAPGPHSIAYQGTRAVVCWLTGKDESVKLSVPSESELLFNSLRRHTRGSEMWSLFDRWKELGGGYLLAMSRFWRQVKRESTSSTGLDIDSSADEPRLTRNFYELIFLDACGHAFSGSTGWEQIPYEIRTIRSDWFELWQGGSRLAASAAREHMERCRDVHKKLMKKYRSPEVVAPALSSAVSARPQLLQLETDIHTELEKLRLKRTFSGHCDLCPE